MTILGDGSPEAVNWVERWLVGGAMRAEPEHVILAAATAAPEDFRDPNLAVIWEVLPSLECPCPGHVGITLTLSRRIDDIGGESYLVELWGTEGAWLYSAHVWLEEHARLVHEQAEKRRTLASLSKQYAEVAYGAPSNIIPIYERPEYRGTDSAV